ncbi:MAG TPA: enolase C-terminal domain-like protein [Bryobacteraceae bacterium]|nr:enolase C-terminal domain-like protein [Bryobacteraceae bacterium]
MNRRSFFQAAAAGSGAALAAKPQASAQTPAAQGEKSKMKVTGVRLVKTTPRKAPPAYTPTPGSWSTGGVEVANPMSIYPKYKPMRSLFMTSDPALGAFTVEISTDKGLKGYGRGGPGGGPIVEKHLTKLLIGEDPFDIERLWDVMWRSTMYYGRMGAVVHAISGVDLALWDLVAKAFDVPVYRLLGGETKPRIPTYCTGNDVEQHLEYGFKRLKLAIPHGPADGKEGMRKNVDLVKRTRELLGPDGDIMLDCWMAWTERYTIEMAQMLEPYKVYWMEECLQPHDYEGFGRLNQAIQSTRIVTGEHEYTRYGFRYLLEQNGASIWQPDINWCGGLTELRRIGALAAAYDIPVIPHGGGLGEAVHYIMATTNSPWAEMFMPAPGGPPEVYRLWEERYNLSKGPEGVYMRPSERPGFGWDFNVS